MRARIEETKRKVSDKLFDDETNRLINKILISIEGYNLQGRKSTKMINLNTEVDKEAIRQIGEVFTVKEVWEKTFESPDKEVLLEWIISWK